MGTEFQKTYQMTTSQLIKLLTKKLEENGDLPIRHMDEENQFDERGDSTPVGGITTIVGDGDKPLYELVASSWSLVEMQ